MPKLSAILPKQDNAMAGNLANIIGQRPKAEALAALIRQLGNQYEPHIDEASGGSVYLTVNKHALNSNGERHKSKRPTPTAFKARFADHGSYWGSSISIDPITKNNIGQALALFKHQENPRSLPEIVEFNRSMIDPGSGAQYVAPVKFNENVFRNGGRDFWREGPRVASAPVQRT